MENKIKSGKEIIDDFFKDLTTLEQVDQDVAEVLIQLYSKGKLTDIHIKNELAKLRKAK